MYLALSPIAAAIAAYFQLFNVKRVIITRLNKLKLMLTGDQPFCTYFSSFEDGIANANSSFKWRKMFIFLKKWASTKLNYFIIYYTLYMDFEGIFLCETRLKPFVYAFSPRTLEHWYRLQWYINAFFSTSYLGRAWSPEENIEISLQSIAVIYFP